MDGFAMRMRCGFAENNTKNQIFSDIQHPSVCEKIHCIACQTTCPAEFRAKALKNSPSLHQGSRNPTSKDGGTVNYAASSSH